MKLKMFRITLKFGKFVNPCIKPRYYCGVYSDSNIKNIEENGVRRITLSNRKSRNALSLSMLKDLHYHISVNKDDINLRSIVLSAEGHVFSCGHDLKELNGTCTSSVRNIFKACTKLMNAITESPVPIIAAVNGIATAAGCQLVAACDIAICTQKSSFALPGANLGIFCSTPSIPVSRRIPKTVLAHMLFTGLPINSSQALQSGLVYKVVSEDTLQSEIDIITNAINSKSRHVLELGKKFVYSQVQMDMKTAYECGENVMVQNIALKDAQEGISSFLNKRKPTWLHTLQF